MVNQTQSSSAIVRCKFCETPLESDDDIGECCSGAELQVARRALYRIANMESCLMADAKEIAQEALPKNWRPM